MPIPMMPSQQNFVPLQQSFAPFQQNIASFQQNLDSSPVEPVLAVHAIAPTSLPQSITNFSLGLSRSKLHQSAHTEWLYMRITD